MTRLDDITLMAFADNELGEDEARAVERALKDNPEAQKRVEAFRATGSLLERTYGPVMEDPMPATLTNPLSPPRASLTRWPRRHPWMALAASVALVVTVGVTMLEPQQTGRESAISGLTPSTDYDVSESAGLTGRTIPYPRPEAPMEYRAKPPSAPSMARAPSSLGAGGALPGASMMADQAYRPPMVVEPEQASRERYQEIDTNPVKRAAEHPVSTFSIDVDTGAYANVRRFLEDGRLPPQDAVRIEEMVNYFTYGYPVPDSREVPFSVTTDMAPAFWNPDLRLLRIGLKGYEVLVEDRPAANLVFLVDVSGSMNAPDKLPLLKASLKMLANQMTAKDRISIVTYAGNAGVVLEPTPGDDGAAIRNALDRLSAGGSTAGAAGIKLAYQMAEKGRIEGGINRILLATDGDFNVGVQDVDVLKEMVAEKRKTGISLTTLGFGTGNYYEELMEQIADVGDGNHAYIDSIKEGRKVLVGELTSTLLTIARDVKIQVEFNPALVAEYRLIGYENRALRREDFSNDKVDAGDLGAGHTVTALYELTLAGSSARRMDPLRYGSDTSEAGQHGDELAFVRLRYKRPGEAESQLIEQPLPASLADVDAPQASDDLRFAGAVAAFGQILRGGTYTGDFGYDDVITLARSGLGPDRHGYRREFVELVEIAKALKAR